MRFSVHVTFACRGLCLLFGVVVVIVCLLWFVFVGTNGRCSWRVIVVAVA